VEEWLAGGGVGVGTRGAAVVADAVEFSKAAVSLTQWQAESSIAGIIKRQVIMVRRCKSGVYLSGIFHLAWVRLLECRIFSAKRPKAEIISHSSTYVGNTLSFTHRFTALSKTNRQGLMAGGYKAVVQL
jgi:hypothetical protein